MSVSSPLTCSSAGIAFAHSKESATGGAELSPVSGNVARPKPRSNNSLSAARRTASATAGGSSGSRPAIAARSLMQAGPCSRARSRRSKSSFGLPDGLPDRPLGNGRPGPRRRPLAVTSLLAVVIFHSCARWRRGCNQIPSSDARHGLQTASVRSGDGCAARGRRGMVAFSRPPPFTSCGWMFASPPLPAGFGISRGCWVGRLLQAAESGNP